MFVISIQTFHIIVNITPSDNTPHTFVIGTISLYKMTRELFQWMMFVG